MKNFVSICTDRSKAVIFLLFVVILSGMFSYISIPKESSPNVKVPIIYVSIPYAGISAEDSVNLLIKPIEKSFRTISNVKKITSTAMEGGASIIVEFIAGVDVDIALQDIRSSVDDNMYKLPDDTKRPQIMEIDLSLEPIISIALNGNVPERSMIEIARDMKYNLESLPSILEAQIEGDREEVLEIIVKPEVLENYKLSAKGVIGAINNNNKLVPAGTLRSATGEYGIKVQSVINDFKAFLNFPIKVNGNSILRVKDVADIKSTFKEPESTAMVNGESAVVLRIKKRSGSNIIQAIDDVKMAINSYIEEIPSQLKISYIQDRTQHIVDMIADLENSIIIAVILVMIVMILTIGARSSLLVALSIPASFFAGILILDVTGHTLNIVVLFSLILTVGMIVDDAIVVSEYADRKMLEGMPSKVAFETAAIRMFWPIFTSTLVKIIVFLPLLFWPGVMGQFMKYMPITAIAILGSSLIFALFMQPSLGPFFGKASHASAEERRSMEASENGNLEDLRGVSAKYSRLLQKILQRPKMFTSVLFGVLVIVYLIFIFAGTGSEFFPKVEPNTATVVVTADGNLSLSQKQNIMSSCEKALSSIGAKEIDVFYTSSGIFKSGNLPSDTIGTIVLEFQDWQKRRKASEILEDVRKKMDAIQGVKYQILQERMGPPARKPIMINVSSSNKKELVAFNADFASYLDIVDGLIDIDNSESKAAIEWHVNVDRGLAAISLLDIGTIGQYIQLIGDGMKIGKYNPTYNDDQVDIMLRLPKENRTVSQIKNLKIINDNNKALPIDNFATVSPAPKVGNITRVNGKATISFTANIKEGILANTKLNEIKEWISKNKPNSINVTFEGDEDEQSETVIFLGKAFLTTLVLMFLVMLIQFNNFYHTFVVMSAVFLSTVGVLLGLLIFNQPFSIVMSGVGIIALGGIVLNNNIIFLDTYQHLISEGIDRKKAIIMTGVQRFRPILLTAVTAILGLLPMVLGLTIDFYSRSITYDAPSSQMWRPLAASIVGGLSFATILTLLFTPCLLMLERDDKNESSDSQ